VEWESVEGIGIALNGDGDDIKEMEEGEMHGF
jgi:hypothetical protein